MAISGDQLSLILRSLTYLLSIFYFGFLFGTLAYFALDQCIDAICSLLFGMKKLDGIDLMIQKTFTNVCFQVISTKADSLKPLQAQIKRNGKHLSKFRSKIVTFFGNLYYQEMNVEELRSKWKQSFVEVDDVIQDEKHLNQFMAKIIQQEFKADDLQYKVYLIKNFGKEESCYFFLLNHALSDGIGSVLVGTSLQDSIDPKQFPFIAKYTLYERIIKHLMLVFVGYYALINNLKLKNENNDNIKQFNTVQDMPLQFTTSSDYKVSQLKQLAKKLKNSTINDLLIGLLCTSFREYFKGQEIRSHAFMNIIFNLRYQPATREEMNGGNILHNLFLTIPIISDFEKALTECKDKIGAFKNSHAKFVLYYFKFFLGYVIPNYAYPTLEKKLGNRMIKIGSTNINGPEVPLTLGASQSKKVIFTSYFKNSCFVHSVFSHCGILKIGLGISKLNIDAVRFMQIYEQQLQSLLDKNQ